MSGREQQPRAAAGVGHCTCSRRWYFHHGVSDWFLYDLRSVGVQDECRLRTVLCAQFEGYVTEEGAAFLRARWYVTPWYQQSRFRRDHLLRVHGEWVVVVYAVLPLLQER